MRSQIGDKLEDLVRLDARDAEHSEHAFWNLGPQLLQFAGGAPLVQLAYGRRDRRSDPGDLLQPVPRDQLVQRHS